MDCQCSVFMCVYITLCFLIWDTEHFFCSVPLLLSKVEGITITHISLFIPIRSTAPSQSILCLFPVLFLFNNLKILPYSLICKFQTQFQRYQVASINWNKWVAWAYKLVWIQIPAPSHFSWWSFFMQTKATSKNSSPF